MERMLADPDSLSRIELISVYINEYYTLDADRREKFEAAFRKKKLPLPVMPPCLPAPRHPQATMDRHCFVSYLLLIYTGTAIFYSWIYLIERLVKMDFAKHEKHKLIQTGIALFYVIAELLLFYYFSSLE
jgi:hypothetical protein